MLGAYVLGALELDEAAAVREHVAACAACAAEYSRLVPLPGLLTLAGGAQRATEEPPSPAMEERLLDAVAREAPRRPPGRRPARRRVLGWAAAGLSAAALAATGVVVIGHDGPSGGYLALRATSASTGATARAELAQASGGTVMQLWVRGLPHDPAAVYEVHCDGPEWSASAGTFRVDATGRAHVMLTTAARRGQYDRIRITRKTATGEHVVFAAALS
jgi:hypothetical protein